MSFAIDESLLPPELTNTEKGRLQMALSQFTNGNSSNKYYTDFYSLKKYSHFLQGDVISEIRFPKFDMQSYTYTKEYFDCILISNTCDMDDQNVRSIEKQVLISKLIPFNDYISALDIIKATNSKKIIQDIKNQQYSNLFYLPPNDSGVDYIVFLDELHFITIEELKSLKEDISDNRISCLDFFGYYLFIFKLSFHLLRLPEETHR